MKLNLQEKIDDILTCALIDSSIGEIIGHSRDGLPIRAHRIGTGSKHISLIGGCHADEPVGPRLLRHLAAYLYSLPDDAPMLTVYTWWLVPHTNPDGEVKNVLWYSDNDQIYDCVRYLQNVVREVPGDDIEFGFPNDQKDTGARPENQAIYDWWKSANRFFFLHASLHGLAVAAGPWFLVEKDWWPHCGSLKDTCIDKVKELGYELHDVDRKGEKGFYRLAKGFCSRPDSRAMRKHFIDSGDIEMADKFRPSSMETIRSFGGDPLTLVSEMPLFTVPRESSDYETLQEWKRKIHAWRNEGGGMLPSWAGDIGMTPMPVKDQMILQWTFISAGIATAELNS